MKKSRIPVPVCKSLWLKVVLGFRKPFVVLLTKEEKYPSPSVQQSGFHAQRKTMKVFSPKRKWLMHLPHTHIDKFYGQCNCSTHPTIITCTHSHTHMCKSMALKEWLSEIWGVSRDLVKKLVHKSSYLLVFVGIFGEIFVEIGKTQTDAGRTASSLRIGYIHKMWVCAWKCRQRPQSFFCHMGRRAKMTPFWRLYSTIMLIMVQKKCIRKKIILFTYLGSDLVAALTSLDVNDFPHFVFVLVS